MRSQLITRLEKLEAMTPPVPTLIQYGWLARLPDDYVGERHVVVLKRESISPYLEWCESEERPGPRLQHRTSHRHSDRTAVTL